ncbi:MAG TPA: 1,4-dihydroxy-2-naphthoate polyprenyltransferase [Opitutaceae bacterium]
MSARPSSLRIWLAASRPRTLPAAIAPVLAASALAWHDGVFVLPAAFACLGFALLVQIGTNFANDYYDFVKGADTAERVGPKRAVAAGWVQPRVMRAAMIVMFGAAFLTGLSLLAYGGWPLLAIGVASIVCGIAYTGGPYPLGYNGLGDVFVFLFFGLVAVGATYFVQAGRVSVEAWLIGAGIGALATNILVVNNYRDVETDGRAGKRTLVVRFGRGFARAQFVAAHGLAVAVIVALAGRGQVNGVAAAVAAAFCGLMGVRQTLELKRARGSDELIVLLGRTGAYLALYAIVLTALLVAAKA